MPSGGNSVSEIRGGGGGVGGKASQISDNITSLC